MTFSLLFEFDRWANNMVLQAASTLNAEEFTRDLGGSFPSVRDTLVHIVGVEAGLANVLEGTVPQLHLVKDYWARHNALFNPNAFTDLAAVQSKWAEIEREQVEFVNRVTNESLGKDASCLRKTNQSGAPHATFGKPFHLPSGSSLANDEAACRRARRH